MLLKGRFLTFLSSVYLSVHCFIIWECGEAESILWNMMQLTCRVGHHLISKRDCRECGTGRFACHVFLAWRSLLIWGGFFSLFSLVCLNGFHITLVGLNGFHTTLAMFISIFMQHVCYLFFFPLWYQFIGCNFTFVNFNEWHWLPWFCLIMTFCRSVAYSFFFYLHKLLCTLT